MRRAARAGEHAGAASAGPRLRAAPGVPPRARWRFLLAAGLILAGCAGAPPPAGSLAAATPARPTLVFGPETDLDAAARQIADRARAAEVVYLGELHDNAQHHAIQTRVLEAILATGSRPALAFEMVPETRQTALEAAVRGDAGPAEVDRQIGWTAQGWPDFAMYWPLFELARKHALPVIATDLDPVLVRRIGRVGLRAAGDDPARLRSALPDDLARDRGIVDRLQAAHCGRIGEDRANRMLESWYARNVVMARRVVGGLAATPQIVVIMGRGHGLPGAVPEQLAAIRPGTRQLMVALYEGQADGPTEPLADVVWVTAARPHPDPCLSLPQRLG
jgi:uncharacterized iron-regulated protein